MTSDDLDRVERSRQLAEAIRAVIDASGAEVSAVLYALCYVSHSVIADVSTSRRMYDAGIRTHVDCIKSFAEQYRPDVAATGRPPGH